MEIKISENGTIELNDFNALQAYKIARKMEHDGLHFYKTILTQCHNDDITSALKYLLASEKDHLAFFEAKIEAAGADGDDGFEDEDIVDFLSADVFAVNDVGEACKTEFADSARALTFGYKMEQQAIQFYTALLEKTQDEVGRTALKEIINEEKRHLETLQQFI